jgi:alpha-L-fucosidase
MNFRLLLSIPLSILSLPLAVQAAETRPAIVQSETKEQRDERMLWWREAKFGMFIHWGLFAQAAGEWNGQPPAKDRDQRGEWLMEAVRMPVADYAKMAATFNHVKFDADQWVKMAKDAGAKYIVFTAKHHEGFAMFQTKVSPYNILDATPFKRDPLRELSAACQKYGVKLGIYYSQTQDWYHPGGFVYKTGPWDPVQTSASFDDYLKKVSIPQITELLTNYGEVAELWWDTPGSTMTRERCEPIAQLVAKLQPGVVMNNRLGGGYEGDISTPEGHVPATGYANRDWESCIPMAATWGYKKNITSYTPALALVTNLIDIASKGGNLLLNVSPMDSGEIPAQQVARMRDIGRWMKVNSEAIYGTMPTIFGAEAGAYDLKRTDKSGNPQFVTGDEWRCTTTENRIYIHFLRWPKDSFTLNDVPNRVTKAYLLADPQRAPVSFTQEGGTLKLTLPTQAPDPQISVLALEIAGPLTRPSKDPLAQASDGTLTLNANTAEIRNDGGSTPTLTLSEEKAVSWIKPEDHLMWRATLKKPGTFTAMISYSLNAEDSNTSAKLDLGGTVLRCALPATEGKRLKNVMVGNVTLTQAGAVPVTLKAAGDQTSRLSVQSVMLLPQP